MQGMVTTFFKNKSYGFIRADDGTDYFFHITRSPAYVPQIGERVEFSLDEPSRIGRPKQAVDLRVAI